MQIRIPFRSFIFFSFCCLCAGMYAQEKGTPKSGEGIAAFLLRHNRSPQKYWDDFIELNKKKLGKDQMLKLGTDYQIPPVKKNSSGQTGSPLKSVIEEPLFGKKMAKVKVHSNRLADCCFYVVSGHGGPDPGAIGKVRKHELHEDEYAYDIALRLARNLMQEGAQVRIVIQDAKDGIRETPYLANSKRETCMGSSIPLGQLQRLQQRSDLINRMYQNDRKKYTYCRAIFIHIDSRSKRKQTDVFFYYANQSALSKQLATQMKTTFECKYRQFQPDRGFSGTVNGRNLYVLSHTKPVSVFVELGNIQNSFDQRRLVISSNRQALSKWLMEGFIADKQNSKKNK